MGKCEDCGEVILSDADGVCIDCSNKRYDAYPVLKEKLEKIIANLKAKKIWEQVKYEIET